MVTLINITKTYPSGERTLNALDNVSMTINEGEMVAIMGPSGSGKSTLMNIIGLLDRPTHGELIINDTKVKLNMRDSYLAKLRSELIGFVFQSFNLLPRLSAKENVLLPTIYAKNGGNTVRAEELLAMVGLRDRMDHIPSKLSGGEKQRVAIARALINNPALILADEPTGNLDTASGTEVMSTLHKLHQNGKTLVIVTHDQEIGNQCQRIIYLRDGKIII